MNFPRTVLTAAAFAGALATNPSMAGDADFTLVDRMGSNTLDNNKSRLFRFSDEAHCEQDLKVVFDDDDDVTWEEIDLCAVTKLTLKYNRATKTVSADTE